MHPGKRLKPGTIVDFPEGLSAEILGIVNEGNRLVRFSFEGDFFDILDRIGQMPLPPYITEKLQDKDPLQHYLLPRDRLRRRSHRGSAFHGERVQKTR